MYGVETRALNQAVRRNIERFPIDFMFQLSQEEWENLKSQFVTSSWGGIRKLPYAFTEQGVAMLSSVLTSKIAIQVNIGIIRTFVATRHALTSAPINEVTQLQNDVAKLREYIEEVFTDYNDINDDTRIQLELINKALAELKSENSALSMPRRRIGYVK